MSWAIAKVFFAAILIGFTSWLAGKRPVLAGFIIALPLSSLVALAFAHAQYRDVAKTVAFARSIFGAIPLSLLFFVPFLFADKIRLGFWALYLMGIGLLALGYGIHSRLFA